MFKVMSIVDRWCSWSNRIRRWSVSGSAAHRSRDLRLNPLELARDRHAGVERDDQHHEHDRRAEHECLRRRADELHDEQRDVEDRAARVRHVMEAARMCRTRRRPACVRWPDRRLEHRKSKARRAGPASPCRRARRRAPSAPRTGLRASGHYNCAQAAAWRWRTSMRMAPSRDAAAADARGEAGPCRPDVPAAPLRGDRPPTRSRDALGAALARALDAPRRAETSRPRGCIRCRRGRRRSADDERIVGRRRRAAARSCATDGRPRRRSVEAMRRGRCMPRRGVRGRSRRGTASSRPPSTSWNTSSAARIVPEKPAAIAAARRDAGGVERSGCRRVRAADRVSTSPARLPYSMLAEELMQAARRVGGRAPTAFADSRPKVRATPTLRGARAVPARARCTTTPITRAAVIASADADYRARRGGAMLERNPQRCRRTQRGRRRVRPLATGLHARAQPHDRTSRLPCQLDRRQRSFPR